MYTFKVMRSSHGNVLISLCISYDKIIEEEEKESYGHHRCSSGSKHLGDWGNPVCGIVLHEG